HDVRGPRSPVETGDYDDREVECVHQRDGVFGERRLLPVSKRVRRYEPSGSVSAQMRNDHAVSLRGEERRDADVTVKVVRPSMQEEDSRPFTRTGVHVTNV